MANSHEPTDINGLLKNWRERVRESQFSHYATAEYYSRLNLWIGIPVVILTSIVGTSVFATLEAKPHPAVQIGVGFISVCAAVLASLQTFLRYSERAEKHRSTASRYGMVRRQIEQLQALPNSQIRELSNIIDDIRKKIDELSSEAPYIPPRVWNREKARMNGESSAK